MEPLKNMLPKPSPLHISALNIPSKWELLYDKFAPAMFGMITRLTTDNAVAENILTEAFISLKRNDLLSSNDYQKSPLIFILRHTYKAAVKYLEKENIQFSSIQNPSHHNEIYWMICTEFQDLKALSLKLGISENDARKKLFEAFVAFNTQNQPATFLA